VSYEIVKRISIEDDKVYVTSADSSIRPLYFSSSEWNSFSKILAEEGRDALLGKIGKEVWDGNLHLRKGSKLCNLFMDALDAMPADLNFSNYDSLTAGEYLGKMVTKLESDPEVDLSSDVEDMLAKRNDRDYIIKSAERTGENFLNFADESLQKDRDLALAVLRAGKGAAWFRYPVYFNNDKEFAMDALRLNGCFYRELSESLQRDKEIIFAAFNESLDRRFHEHLPDIIPQDVFCHENGDHSVSIDRDFLFDLMEICPSLHLHRTPDLIADREIALKWCEVGKFFPHSVVDLSNEVLEDTEIQNALCQRFKSGEKRDILKDRFDQKGIKFPAEPLDQQIEVAEAHKAEQSGNGEKRQAKENAVFHL